MIIEIKQQKAILKPRGEKRQKSILTIEILHSGISISTVTEAEQYYRELFIGYSIRKAIALFKRNIG